MPGHGPEGRSFRVTEVDMTDLVIVDAQNDFIDGTLACAHAQQAVNYLVDFMNGAVVSARYTSDWHSPQNGSFAENGGTWPVHCVAGTSGAALSSAFDRVSDPKNRPGAENLFLKGRDDAVEEYSAFLGKNAAGKTLDDVLGHDVIVAGIALEYCVKETALDLVRSGRNVIVLREGVGYVDEGSVEKVIAELKTRGIIVL